MPYPTKTQALHYEVELVVAIGKAGANVREAQAHELIFGYAVSDTTRPQGLAKRNEKIGSPVGDWQGV
ncbi:MAG: fumarylacetoacetate hydrolase family protein [Moraxella sp.]